MAFGLSGIAGAVFGGPVAVATAVTGGEGFFGYKAASQERKAIRAQRRLADIQQKRAVLDTVRKARIARAEVISAGANVGATGSSAVEGGAGSVVSQLGGQVSFLEKAGAANQASLTAQEKASRYTAYAGLSKTIFDTGTSFATIFGGG